MRVRIKRLDEKAIIPQYQTSGSAAVDLCACISEPITIYPGSQEIIGTGMAIDIGDPNVCAKVYPRSGLGSKGLIMGNSVGVIDSDYQGEIKLICLNRWSRLPHSYDPKRDIIVTKNEKITINPGDRVAQMIFEPVIRAEFEEVEEFAATERGEGGFGSTGVNG